MNIIKTQEATIKELQARLEERQLDAKLEQNKVILDLKSDNQKLKEELVQMQQDFEVEKKFLVELIDKNQRMAKNSQSILVQQKQTAHGSRQASCQIWPQPPPFLGEDPPIQPCNAPGTSASLD